MKRKTAYYVNVYSADQVYGGPEEGGWWYEVGRPVLTARIYPEAGGGEDAIRVRDALRRLYPHSGRPDAESFRVRIEGYPARAYPARRPVYC